MVIINIGVRFKCSGLKNMIEMRMLFAARTIRVQYRNQ